MSGVPDPDPGALRLGFARGVAPSKWARRWAEAAPGGPALELVPLGVRGASGARGLSESERGLDVVLERVAPGARPAGSAGPAPARHAVRLYAEAVSLVVAADHELAGQSAVAPSELALVTLLDHPDHAPGWPDPEPWRDPSWVPADAAEALELVATGAGAILLPLPLARHLAGKRAHAVLPVAGEPALPGTEIWASWAVERDGADVQRLVGILRGRSARSGRAEFEDAPAAAPSEPEPGSRSKSQPRPRAAKKPPKNSRGAQLAAAKARRRGRR